MSLVRSAAFFGNHELYTMKDGNNSPELTSSTFNSDNPELFSSDCYDAKYLLDSPSEEFGQTFGSASYQMTSEKSSFDSSFVVSRHNNAYLDSRSPDTMDYNEDKLRLKLQELEALLGDNNNNPKHSMEIDDCSPKESSSSDSIFSSTSSTKEILLAETLTPKEVLFKCASAIHNESFDDASRLINALRQRVSIHGEPSERIAAYMVEALAARLATSGRGLYKALKCKVPPSSDQLSAMQVLFEACPCFRFGFMAANGAILEAIGDEKRVHIVDFDINQGSQYYTLLQTLAGTPGKRPHIRVTGIDDPETVQRPVGGLQIIGRRLEQLAEDLGVPFEFRAIAAETALISPSMLGCCQPGEEALIVNFAFQLHHMPDESVSTINLRDRLLRMVKSLKPKLVTVVEQDVNTNTAPFLSRFAEAYSYYSAVFESLDATLGKESQDRVNVEKQCLARDIINVVACEGEERIERYEVAGKWRARMSMAGFSACPISGNVKEEIRRLIGRYSDRFKVREETGALHFGWEEKTLIVSSAWR